MQAARMRSQRKLPCRDTGEIGRLRQAQRTAMANQLCATAVLLAEGSGSCVVNLSRDRPCGFISYLVITRNCWRGVEFVETCFSRDQFSSFMTDSPLFFYDKILRSDNCLSLVYLENNTIESRILIRRLGFNCTLKMYFLCNCCKRQLITI